jgi:hypothetical protein
MDQFESQRQARRRGATVIIIAAAGFLVGCFLPYYRPDYQPAASAPANLNVSLYRLETLVADTGSPVVPRIGGLIALFGGVIIVAWLAIQGLANDSDWTFGALAGAAAVWSIAWIAALLRATGFGITPQIGWWLVLVCASVGLVGGILVAASTRSRLESPVNTVTD